jgi:hypothetical protein
LDPLVEVQTHRASLLLVAATVIASGALAGERLQASVLPLPAATAKVTPALIEFWTAWFRVLLVPPERLMLATAGSSALAVTQSIPPMTAE